MILLLPDDNWDLTCHQIGCGLPSNLEALFLSFYAVAFLLGPLGIVLLLATAVIRRSGGGE